MAAAKRVDALRDGDVTLGPFPAAVTHTGALVVLAITAAQHWARRWRNRGIEIRMKGEKLNHLTQLTGFLGIHKSHSAQPLHHFTLAN